MKKVCNIFITILLLFTNKIYSQNFNTDEKCIEIAKKKSESIVKDLVRYNGLSKYIVEITSDYFIAERYNNQSPRIIKFNYCFTYKTENLNTRHPVPDTEICGTACIYFNNGYALAYYDEKKDDNWSILASSQDYSTNEYKTILKLFDNYSNNRLKSNESFQNVVTKLRSYPVSTNPKNCLSVVTKNEKQYAINWYVKKSQLIDKSGYSIGDAPLYDQIDYGTHEFQVNVDYYKNICNHDIVLKGILKSIYSKKYLENSILLKPNETTGFFKFTTGGWHEYSTYNTQFLYDSDINQIYSENNNSNILPVSTPTRTQSNEQTYTKPVTEPVKSSTPPMTNTEIRRYTETYDNTNEKNPLIIEVNNEIKAHEETRFLYYKLLHPLYRKSNEYKVGSQKYKTEIEKERTDKIEYELKYEQEKKIIEELKNKHAKIRSNEGKNSNSITNNSEVKSTFIKSYNGTITNKTINSTTKCQMTFSKNSDGTFQLKGETDKINLVGKWNLKGKVIENNIYLFKGDIILGYEGTDFPLGTSAPFSVTVKINDKSMIGNYSIQSNDKSIGTQEGIFTLR